MSVDVQFTVAKEFVDFSWESHRASSEQVTLMQLVSLYMKNAESHFGAIEIIDKFICVYFFGSCNETIFSNILPLRLITFCKLFLTTLAFFHQFLDIFTITLMNNS